MKIRAPLSIESKRKKAELNRLWRINNPEKHIASNLKWYKKNRERMMSYLAEWKIKNKDNYLKGIKEWKLNNHDKVRCHGRKSDALRRAAKIERLHPDHDFNIERLMIIEARKIEKITGIRHEIDHVIPLSRGGWHHHDNLQILDKPTNLEKHANPFWRKDGFKSFAEVCYTLWPDDLVNHYNRILSEEQQCLS